MKLDAYMEKLRNHEDDAYKWPLQRYEKRLVERAEVHKEFPHVVTMQGNYGYGGDDCLDDREAWCRKKFGDMDGKCTWHFCPDGFHFWYDGSKWEKALDDELEKIKEQIKNDQLESDATMEAINSHYAMLDTLPECPDKGDDGHHHHTGTWRGFFIVKTGYDYGYQDFCFKEEGDAIQFKMEWGQTG